MLATVDQLAGDDAVGEDFGVGVDVAQEEIESGDALGESALDAVPLGRGDEAGKQVVGEDALGAFVAAVDGEGDALGEEGEVGGLLAALELVGGQAGEGLGEGAVVGAQFAVGFAHLVEGVGRAGSLRRGYPIPLSGRRSCFPRLSLVRVDGAGWETAA